MAFLRILLLVLSTVATCRLAVAEPIEFKRVPPTHPDRAEFTFRCLHGFSMQLLAAEPLVTDPVALEYDEQGRAWVVEMCDYPYTDKSTDKPNVERTTDAPLGRIRILEDTDGDGRFDRSDIFAEDLSWPTGLALWKGGCYVTATPDVWYLKDTDGDRRADVRRRVFTGFRKFNIQSVINNLRWGLDHKLYAAGGTNGGTITKPGDTTSKPIPFTRGDFAFDPRRDAEDGETFEILTGGARFGQTFDDYGNRFICNIRNPVQHIVLENRYLARNPYLAVTNAIHDAAEAGDTLPVYRASPPEPWRVVRALNYRRETGGTTLPRSELAGEGYFTSACGITLYRGAAYPKEFYGNAFIGEVAGNLIHRQILTPDGVTFKSRRGDEKAEFVASTDNWFRPVNFTNAPDGTLHVCDMYRETIEHPWSISDELKAALDLESGRDRGRIYRLAPPDFVVPKTKPNLADATAAELVAALENPNSWWRDTAHRLIFERQDKACVEPLRKLLWEGNSELGRLHALWSLEGLAALDQEDLLKALHDASATVRRHGVLLSESRFESLSIVLRRVSKMTDDPDPRVRFQVDLSLGNSSDPNLATWLASALNKATDEWQMIAVLTSSARRASDILLESDGKDQFQVRDIPRYAHRQLASFVGAEADPATIEKLLRAVGRKDTRSSFVVPIDGKEAIGVRGGRNENQYSLLIAGLAEGLRRSGKTLSQVADSDESKALLKRLITGAATTIKTDERNDGLGVMARFAALQLLAQGAYADAMPSLVTLLAPKQPAALQVEAVRALASFNEAEVPSLLLKNYRSISPAAKSEVVEALASRADRQPALLDAIEQKVVNVGDIPQARRLLLGRAKDPAVAARALKLFEQGTAARAPVVEKYREALKLTGDAERGLAVFRRECKTCHRLRDEGFEVGPNLATILHRTPDELITHIMDPSREVSPNYLEYVVALDDGRTLTGLIAEETAAAITLRRAENVQQTILRRNIDEMSASGKSLMPEGLEQKVDVQGMADLLAFLLQKR